ncbi:MAG: NrfD/PsrC family molybdoenzyme membrane anchor subunit, partial [Saprospiraceae bacterium]|nr:NrfD/PsrC family molybdoenzyme membrane anchor subunit [Saprospiraceae bacterium]
MQIRASSLKMVQEFAPHLVRTTGTTKIWIAFLVGLIAFGAVGPYYQIRYGHVVTGMRDHVVWGMYIVNFIFFIGISYAGAIVAGFLHLLRVPWRRPIMRMAGLISVICGIVGPVFIILCIGRFDRLHYLVIHPRLQSPIIWDVVAISTYLVGAIIFLYLFVIRDFAI